MSILIPKITMISDESLCRLTDLRIHNPGLILQLAQARQRRAALAPDGRLNILACDHPARRVNRIGTDALAMADRRNYLERIVAILRANAADGVMATMDILEELLLLQEILDDPFLDHKVMIASLNRGGLAGTAWEMDDPVTGALPATCEQFQLDGAKILLRIDDTDSNSLKTLQACARLISDLNTSHLPCFLEPLPVRKTDSGYQIIKNAQALAETVGVASALGNSSRYLWLKLPYCDEFETVAKSTTLPILLLGGDATGQAENNLVWLREALASAHNVRGVMLGRNVLYPGNANPVTFAASIHQLVHVFRV
jgi:DhnA family fructose-bisphosphate aldolase class Ia